MASVARLWSCKHIRVSATWVSTIRASHSSTRSHIYGLAIRTADGSRDGDGPPGVRTLMQHPLSFGSSSELAKQFLSGVLACPLVQRAELLRTVCDTTFDESTCLDMGEKIVESLVCDSHESDRLQWRALAAMVWQCATLELLSSRESKALLKYLEFVLQQLSSDERAGSADVLNVLRLVRYNHRLSLNAVNGLHRAHKMLVRELAWLGMDVATQPQLELVHALGLKVPPHSFIDVELVSLCYDNLALLMPSYEMPEHEWQHKLVARVADAAVQLNVYHAAFLDSFAEYLICMAHARRLRGVTDSQFYLYLFAYMDHPARELFVAIKAALEDPDAVLEVGETDNVHDYIVLNWAFLSQGVEPPESLVSRMWHLLQHWEKYPLSRKALRSYYELNLLDQLMAMAPRDLSWLRQHVLATLGDITRYSKAARRVQERLPGVGVGCTLDAGCVWMYALVDADTGFIVPWPADLDPRKVRKDMALPGRPAAVLFTHINDKLKKAERCNGVLARKVSILRESGWAVVHVLASDSAKATEDGLVKAVSEDISAEYAVYSTVTPWDPG